MFFSGFEGIWRTLIVGLCAYAALVGVLRITGKRTLTKMNAFDLVVTVALGSTLATIVLSKDVALAEGVTAFVLLAGAQYAVTWTSLRSPRFRRWIKAEPRALLRDGLLGRRAARRARDAGRGRRCDPRRGPRRRRRDRARDAGDGRQHERRTGQRELSGCG